MLNFLFLQTKQLAKVLSPLLPSSCSNYYSWKCHLQEYALLTQHKCTSLFKQSFLYYMCVYFLAANFIINAH